jgi:hypothetical protein
VTAGSVRELALARADARVVLTLDAASGEPGHREQQEREPDLDQRVH